MRLNNDRVWEVDTRRSVLNISASIVSRVILLVAGIVVRRLLIAYIGSGVNGLNSLYSSIIGMLSVVELGVGSAIVYSMYRPIIDGDRRTVAALYGLYKRAYYAIGILILAGGLIATPFLPHFVSDYATLGVDVPSTFLLTLVSVVLTYAYSAKTSLIEAHKDNYVTTAILTAGRLVRYVLQAATIYLLRSFEAFLVCQIVETILVWALTEAVVRRRYGQVIAAREVLDEATRGEVVRNVRAMFMHKVGTILVNSIDSVIISAFIGVVALGNYSNYTLLSSVVASIVGLFFSPLTSVVGHLCASGEPEVIEHYFRRLYALNYVLGVVSFLGYFAIADYAVTICFGGGLTISRTIVFIITLNQFTQFMRRTSLLFRDASGTFYNDRYKPVAEGVVNLMLSLFLVNAFPADCKVAGVVAATIVTTLTICDIVEPYVVFHHVFDKGPGSFYLKSYAYVALFVAALLVVDSLSMPCRDDVTGLIMNGGVSLAVSAATLGLLALVDRAFRDEVAALAHAATGWVRARMRSA